MTCKSGALTQDGGRSSLSRVNTSATSDRQIDALMSLDLKMMKEQE
jgi:hypothetical protein